MNKLKSYDRPAFWLLAIFGLLPGVALLVSFTFMVIGDQYGRQANWIGVPGLIGILVVLWAPPLLILRAMRRKSWLAYLFASLVTPAWFLVTLGITPGLSAGGVLGTIEGDAAIIIALGIMAFYWWATYKVKKSSSSKKS